MPDPRHRIKPSHLELGRKLRREMTIPEKVLWKRLKNGKLMGLKFRRQHPVESYVLDFYNAENLLCVELDGRSHDDREEYDQRRTQFLESLGIRVIRISNSDAAKDLATVVKRIALACGKQLE